MTSHQNPGFKRNLKDTWKTQMKLHEPWCRAGLSNKDRAGAESKYWTLGHCEHWRRTQKKISEWFQGTSRRWPIWKAIKVTGDQARWVFTCSCHIQQSVQRLFKYQLAIQTLHIHSKEWKQRDYLQGFSRITEIIEWISPYIDAGDLLEQSS